LRTIFTGPLDKTSFPCHFPEWRAIDVFAVLLPVGEVHVVSEVSQKNAILSFISKERIAFFRLDGILFS
jgi:hypothetical protein